MNKRILKGLLIFLTVFAVLASVINVTLAAPPAAPLAVTWTLPIRPPYYRGMAGQPTPPAASPNPDSSLAVHGLTYAAGPVDNPLKGFVPYYNFGDTHSGKFPFSMEWSYFALSEVQNNASDCNSFNWSIVDNFLNDVASRGRQSILRFYVEYPGGTGSHPANGIPPCVNGKVTMRTNAYWNTTSPDYDDPDMINAFTTFIAAFGARYDGDPRIGFIQAGLVGLWGEWHTWPYDADLGPGSDTSDGYPNYMPTAATMSTILDAYDAAFNKTSLEVRYAHVGDARTDNIGYHDDSFAYIESGTVPTAGGGKTLPISIDGKWDAFTQINLDVGAENAWATKSMGAEVRPEIQLQLFSGGSQVEPYLPALELSHLTWALNESGIGNYNPTDQTASDYVRHMGYDLSVKNAYYNNVAPGAAFKVGVQIENRGVAPFYYPWTVQVGLKNSGGAITSWNTAWDIRQVEPNQIRAFPDWSVAGNPTYIPFGNPYYYEYTIANPGVAAGNYTVVMKVVNPLSGGRQFQFSNNGQGTDGWLSLGSVTIGSVSATNTPGPTATPTKTNTPGGPTNTPTRTNTPGPAGLKVQYMASNTNPSDSAIAPSFLIVNTSGVSIPLSELKLRYWYTIDSGVQTQTFGCNWIVVGCANTTNSFVAMSSSVTNADHYMELAFTSAAGSIAAGGNSGDIQVQINKTDNSTQTESNDYSFDPTKTAYADWGQVTLYRNGALVWGTEPTGGTPVPPTNTPTKTNTPVGPTNTSVPPTNTPTKTNTPVSPTATSAGGVTSYEAEAAGNTLAGGAGVVSCSTCSGGNKVGNVGNNSGTLQFNALNAASAGNYTLTIYYINGDAAARNATISVNGGTGSNISFPVTGSWTTVGSLQTTISLNAGSSNTIKFSNATGWAPDFDRITLNTSGGPTNTPIPPTNTPVPPTNTPTKTNTPAGPTNTPTKTNTPVPPTVTPTSAASLLLDNFDGAPVWSTGTTNDLGHWAGANGFVNGTGGAGAESGGALVLQYANNGWFGSDVTQDVSGKTYLVFVIKGAAGGEENAFHVSLGGVEKTFAAFSGDTITTAYKTIRINMVTNGVNRTAPGQLNMTFWWGSNGTITIDEIRFE